MKKLENITQKQIASKGVQSLADRPNANTPYGVGGLSPSMLKLWFDKLATFLAEKINELQNTLSADDAASYIRLLLDDYGVESIDDLVKSFTNGKFAEQILQVYPSASSDQTLSLQNALQNISEDLARKDERIDEISDAPRWTHKALIDNEGTFSNTDYIAVSIKHNDEGNLSFELAIGGGNSGYSIYSVNGIDPHIDGHSISRLVSGRTCPKPVWYQRDGYGCVFYFTGGFADEVLIKDLGITGDGKITSISAYKVDELPSSNNDQSCEISFSTVIDLDEWTRVKNLENPTILQGTGNRTDAVMSQKAATDAFVPKAISSFSLPRAHCVSANSLGEELITVNENPSDASIPRRGSGGVLKVGAPIANNDATTKEYVDDNLTKKVAIVSGSGGNRIYGVDPNGNQKVFAGTSGNYAWSVPLRGENFTFTVGEPTDAAHPATKKYVEDHFPRFRHNVYFDICPDGDVNVSASIMFSYYSTSDAEIGHTITDFYNFIANDCDGVLACSGTLSNNGTSGYLFGVEASGNMIYFNASGTTSAIEVIDSDFYCEYSYEAVKQV